MGKKASKIAELSEDERCSIARDISFDEWFAVCGKERAFCEIAALLGIDEPDKLLEQCDSIIVEFDDKNKRRNLCEKKIKSVVMCVAWAKFNEEEQISLNDSIKDAWVEVKDKCKEAKVAI